LTASLKAGSGH
jgi:hypothetical protein